MPYIGNNIRSADDYRLIDDISSSFNGSLTTFALLTAGASPLPFPKSPQQCLISVNGVIQEPDPTGSSGFNLVGTNIVFSSAPTAGHSFFGIIYATADYLNAGGTFPAGSTGSPSITFTTDTDTGIYRRGSGDIGFVSNSTEIVNIDGNGLTVTSKDATINSITVGKGTNSVAGNTVLGETALDAAVTGDNNTAIGKSTLSSLTSGTNNTALGIGSLASVTTGNDNTALGKAVLNANTGSNNTGVGYQALISNTSASENTAVGFSALTANTTGGNNTAIGNQSLLSNTTASFNVGVGHHALENNTTGGSNIAVGSDCLRANTTASNNTGVGYASINANTTGQSLTAVGESSLTNNTTGNDNTGIGRQALEDNTTGTGNTAVGNEALENNTTAGNNTAVGHLALLTCTTGGANTALGMMALYGTTSGTDNIGIGKQAGQDVTTGTNNMFFGLDAGRSGTPSGSVTTASNQLCMGNNSISNCFIKVDWTVTSDRRDKTDIKPFTHGLSWINKLNPVTYRWDNRSFYEDGKPDGSKKQKQLNVGLIAQDEIEVEKEHGFGDTAENMIVSHINEDGDYGMQYAKLVPILINAIKELSVKVTALEAG